MTAFDPKAPNPNNGGSNNGGGSGSGWDDEAFREVEQEHVSNQNDGDQAYRQAYDATYNGVVRSQPKKSGR